MYEQELDTLIRRNASAGRLQFTADAAAAVAHCTLQFIGVGVPLDEDSLAALLQVLTPHDGKTPMRCARRPSRGGRRAHSPLRARAGLRPGGHARGRARDGQYGRPYVSGACRCRVEERRRTAHRHRTVRIPNARLRPHQGRSRAASDSGRARTVRFGIDEVLGNRVCGGGAGKCGAGWLTRSEPCRIVADSTLSIDSMPTRPTVTSDPDLRSLLDRARVDRDSSLERAANDAIQTGPRPTTVRERQRYERRPYGPSLITLFNAA